VYERGIPNAIVCDSPSTEAITGDVIAIDSDDPFSTTGVFIAIFSFLVFPPKIYPATILKP
jgi:hypothetical protein